METRVLIPKELRLVVSDGRLSTHNERSNVFKFVGKTEEENEEKPSSSSGHCETGEESYVEKHFKDGSAGTQSSSTDGDDNKSWQKMYNNHPNSSSSSTTSFNATSSDSSSSENELDSDYFPKNDQKLENQIGSSSNPFEGKKRMGTARKRENDREGEKGSTVVDQSHVKVFAARVIEKGTVFSPNDGDVQVVHLKEISVIPKNDIRFIFGCFETIAPLPISSPPPATFGRDPYISPASTTTSANSPPPPQENHLTGGSGTSCNFVRLCNWVRFLRHTSSLRQNSRKAPPQKLLKLSSDSEEDAAGSKNRQNSMENNRNDMNSRSKKSSGTDTLNAIKTSSSKISFLTTANGSENSSNNVVARFIDGRPIFEVTERLVPGTELVAHFDMSSILKHSSVSFPHMDMMTKLPTMTSAATTPSPPMNISSSPPAPSCSSTRISSSSPKLFKSGGGGGVEKKVHDEKEGIQQYYPHQLLGFPYSYHNSYAAGANNVFFKSFTDGGNGSGNPFTLWQENPRLGRRGKGDERRKHGSSLPHGGITEGPLDLSKFPDLRKCYKAPLIEPLKIGTPFDSPDSNDDEIRKSTSPVSGNEGGGFSSFSIRNVLKHQSVGSPSKLFQPYSLEIGKKCAERDVLMKALTIQSSSGHANSLVTPPSGSETSLTIKNPTGLRPILRTRGRERSLLPCEVCGKAFDRPSLLKRHLRTHTGEKPHICDVCSKGFSTSSSLNTHRRIHSGEKPHQCPICGKRFTASSNLYYHRMTHNKEKPHKCLICLKSFPTPGDLKSHQYVHSGSWPYTCPVCHRGFSKQTNLRNHLLLHSGIANNTAGGSGSKSVESKPYTCQICDKKFAQACNLRAHMKTHDEPDEITANCSICKRTFISTADMLYNDRCRNCLLSASSSKSDDTFASNQNETLSIPISTSGVNTSATNAAEKTKDGFTANFVDATSMLPHRMASSFGTPGQQGLASSVGHVGLSLSQFSGLSIPTLPSGVSFPTNTGNAHFPVGANHSSPHATDLFVNSGATPSTRNPLLEQLVEWNYRIAKESVGIGSLGFSFMQQKLLESRMLAAQLMNTHGFGINGAMPDLFNLRSAITSTEGFSSFDPVVQNDNKFMQR